jgi:hypothetical protein
MWIYSQSTGALTSPNGELVGFGYSGNGADLNNPSGQADVGHGPIPRGDWSIGKFHDDPGGKGPLVCHLTPCEGNDMDGRDGGFMIHGDNRQENHSASHGCIILFRPFREKIGQSEDRLLRVVE